MKRILGFCGLLACIFVFISGVAFSQQDYPTKPVTMLHGFSAGGNTDLSIRVLGEALSKIFKQPFVTVPKPGGGQTIAASFLAHSAPDGYTIGHFYQGVFSRVPLYQDVPYKLEDFKPVIAWQYSPELLVCKSDAPYKDLKELAAAAKDKTITFGHNGKASQNYLIPRYFAQHTGIKLQDVPFKGDADQLIALMGGHIQLASVTEVAADQLLAAGNIRALACYSKNRLSYHPDVPTFAEYGYSIPFIDPIGMAFVPKGTPDAIVKQLHDAIKQCIDDPNVKPMFAKVRQALIYFDAKSMLEIIEKEKELFYPVFKEMGMIK